MKTISNEEKAKELATRWKAKGLPYNAIYDTAIEVMEYKDEEHAKEKQQMKEVKLTWKDMREIVAISDRMLMQKGNLDDKGFYEAVLEQFKA